MSLLLSLFFFFFFPRYSNIDMKTQEAYELAVKGLIRPMGKSPPIITAVRCLQFALPEFQLGRTGTECTGELLSIYYGK